MIVCSGLPSAAARSERDSPRSSRNSRIVRFMPLSLGEEDAGPSQNGGNCAPWNDWLARYPHGGSGLRLGTATVFSATSLVLCALPAEEEEVDDDHDDDRDDDVGRSALVHDRAPPVSSWNRRSIGGPGASSQDASYGEASFQERPRA